MFDLLIRGHRVVTPHGVGPWEIAVRDGVIAALGARGTFADAQAARVIDVGGGIVMPGGIDPHVHCAWYMPAFRPGEPSGLSGPPEQVSRAALWGGTTTLIDFAACKPDREGDESSSQGLRDAIEARDRDWAGRCYCDYAYHIMLRGRVPPSTIAELAEAVQAGYPTIKLFTTDITPSRRGRMVRFGDLWEIFKVAARAGGLGVIHAEDNDIVVHMYEKLFAENRTGFEHMAEVHNTLSEDLSFRRIIRLAENVEGMALYMMHVSAAAGVQAIAESRARGFPIYGETLHQYLLYTSDDYRRPNGQIYHTYPSLKSRRDQQALWDGLAHGDLHSVATDEVCCKLAVKVQGNRVDDTTGGNSGVEPRVAVMYTETVEKRGYSLEKFVDVVSTNAARITRPVSAQGGDRGRQRRRYHRARHEPAPHGARRGPARERLHPLGGQGSRRLAGADRAARQGHGRRRTIPRRPEGRAVPQAPHPGRHPGATQREQRQRSMTMKVSWFHRFGGPEVLVCEETGKPTPGAGEAVVRVRAVGINHVDLDHRAGTSRIPITFPHILGREFAGEVAALGDKAGPLKEGDRVWVTCRVPCGTCEFCLSGRDNLCVREGFFGLDLPGGYAEYVKVPIANLNPLPSHVGFEDAAASQIAFGTAWHVLINRGGLQAGQSVLIQAAGSGIGSAAVQVARLAGATIFATASSDQKLERAKALGAHHLINYSRENFAERVLDLTGGRGVDVVMEHVGGEVFIRSLQCLKRNGVIVTVGAHAGEVVSFDIIPFFRRELRLAGSKNASVMELRTVMGLVAEGKLKPVIHRSFPLAEAAEAHRVVESREIFGKVLLLP